MHKTLPIIALATVFLVLCNHTSTAHGNLRKGLLTRAILSGQEHDKGTFFLFFPILQGFRHQGMKNWKEQGGVR